jgi:pimeloyl-ACP methyl ester carboxylesterase
MILPELVDLIQSGRRGEAVEYFQIEAVGLPLAVVDQLRHAPFRPALEQMAHTLVYEAMILEALSPATLAAVTAPTLVLDGDQSPPVMRQAAAGLAAALPHATYTTLAGQGHDLAPAALAPMLESFYLGQ